MKKVFFQVHKLQIDWRPDSKVFVGANLNGFIDQATETIIYTQGVKKFHFTKGMYLILGIEDDPSKPISRFL